MPAYTRNKKRADLVFVPVNQYLYFGFKPKDLTSFPGVSSEDITALGHILTSAIPEGGLRIIGANAPQPPRVTKKIANATVSQQRTISTFCGHDKLLTAQAKGWNLTKGKLSISLKPANANRSSLTAIAILSNSIHYCFPMNKADFDNYGVALGLKSPAQITSTVDQLKFVSGSTSPKPGKASKKLEDGSTFTSFYSDAKESDLTGDGWNILSQENVLESGVPF
ncbi:hypothetical protein [Nostoc sp. PCC 7107]|uniref:hypothetical protein n=1 Tax=Nostoc sp. PCC 7107 TaxID=317936 RepID=UPI00029EEDB1|nr:hypothetical protein [Nostoc sp. PCC 7107]AFY43665.1 hypothetical protein Nos7107_3074 [Nostoc sp. PCC 7107]